MMTIQLKFMNNPEIEKLKQDIVSTQKIVKEQQKDISKQIDNGWLDDMDEVLENTPNYFNESFLKINPFPQMEKDKEIKPKKGLLRLLDKIKNII